MSLEIQSLYIKEGVQSFYLSEEEADKIFALYRKFIDEAPAQRYPWMKEEFLSVEKCHYYWQDLDIGVSDETMGKVLSETGVLPLREVDKDCRILVVGCGNNPIADDRGYPLAARHCNVDKSERYRECHEHREAITINPLLAANPTLVGFFGAQKFPMLADGQFDLIAIEGTMIEDTPVGREELKRLLSSHGAVVQYNGLPEMKAYEFSWENQREPTSSMPVAIEDITVYPSFQQA